MRAACGPDSTVQITLACGSCDSLLDSFTYTHVERAGAKWEDGMPCPGCGSNVYLSVYMREPPHPGDAEGEQ